MMGVTCSTYMHAIHIYKHNTNTHVILKIDDSSYECAEISPDIVNK